MRARLQRAEAVSVLNSPVWVPRRLPEMSLRILEVARVPAPERVASRLDDDRARLPRLIHHGVDFGLRRHVVADTELGRAPAADGQACVVRQARTRPERELQSGLEIEESDGTVLELSADDAFGLQPEAVTVEPDRSFQIIDAQGQDGNPWLHGILRQA